MTARPPRKRHMPSRKAMQRALKSSMAGAGERIAAKVFLLFSLGVIATGVWMWPAEEDHVVAVMFIVIGVIAAVFSLRWGK